MLVTLSKIPLINVRAEVGLPCVNSRLPKSPPSGAGPGTSSSQSPKDAQSGGAAEPAPAPPAHPWIGLRRPPAPHTPANTQTYLCITPALVLPCIGSENSAGLMCCVPCLLTSAAECDPQAGSPCRWPVALTQACVSAGEIKQYFSSMGVFQRLCKVPASTFVLAQAHVHRNTPQHPPAPRCDCWELLPEPFQALQAWGQNRALVGLQGEQGRQRGHQRGHSHKALCQLE